MFWHLSKCNCLTKKANSFECDMCQLENARERERKRDRKREFNVMDVVLLIIVVKLALLKLALLE